MTNTPKFKTIAIVCILSVTFYSCASTTSRDQYGNISFDEDAYRDRKIAAAILGIAALVLLVIYFEESKKQNEITMDSWMGEHVSKLIRSWGPPQRVISDGASGKIYIWSSRVKNPFSQREKYDRVRMFWVNSRGIIYHWRAKGL